MRLLVPPDLYRRKYFVVLITCYRSKQFVLCTQVIPELRARILKDAANNMLARKDSNKEQDRERKKKKSKVTGLCDPLKDLPKFIQSSYLAKRDSQLS